MNRKYGALLFLACIPTFIVAKKYTIYVDNQTTEPEKVVISGPIDGRGKRITPTSLLVPAGYVGVILNVNIRKPGKYVISSEKPDHYMTFAIGKDDLNELFGHTFYFKITPPHFQQITYPYERLELQEKVRENQLAVKSE